MCTATAMPPAATVARADDAEVEQIVRRHVQPMLIAAGIVVAASATAITAAAITRIFPSRRGWAEWPCH